MLRCLHGAMENADEQCLLALAAMEQDQIPDAAERSCKRFEKVSGMGDHFERGAPGMHTSDTIDYGIVVRGELTLDLDDGQDYFTACALRNDDNPVLG
jgi:hypothetical protein